MKNKMDFHGVPATELLSKDDLVGLRTVYNAFLGSGIVTDEAGAIYKVSIKDLITSETMARFIPQTVEVIVREAIEPNLIVEQALFQGIAMGTSSRVEIGSLGAIRAAELAQNQEYPTADIQMDGGYMVSFDVTKKGIMVPVTQEVLDDNLFDIITLWLRAAGRAMARLSEELAVKTLLEMGVLMYDNGTPGNSLLGSLTGRNIAGDGNGSMCMNDIFKMVAEQMLRGFSPSHLLINPLAWVMFATDPEIREIMFGPGGKLSSEAMPQGQASQGWGTTHQGYGLRTVYHGTQAGGPNPFVTTPNPLQATWQIQPRGLPGPLTALVTPFMPYTASATTIPITGKPITDIALVDSQRAGVRLNRQPIRTDEWNDPLRDVRNIKLSERYGHAVLEQGKGIAIATNVVLAKNYVFDNTNLVTLAEHEASTSHVTL